MATRLVMDGRMMLDKAREVTQYATERMRENAQRMIAEWIDKTLMPEMTRQALAFASNVQFHVHERNDAARGMLGEIHVDVVIKLPEEKEVPK